MEPPPPGVIAVRSHASTPLRGNQLPIAEEAISAGPVPVFAPFNDLPSHPEEDQTEFEARWAAAFDAPPSRPPARFSECPNGCGRRIDPADAEFHLIVCTRDAPAYTCRACRTLVREADRGAHRRACPQADVLARIEQYDELFSHLEGGDDVGWAVAEDRVQRNHEEEQQFFTEIFTEARKHWAEANPAASVAVRDYDDETLELFLDPADPEEREVFDARPGPRWDLLRPRLRQRALAYVE